jgi:hypothetical protein
MLMNGNLTGLLHMETLMEKRMGNCILSLQREKNKKSGSRLLLKAWDISTSLLLDLQERTSRISFRNSQEFIYFFENSVS